jgi:O-antigen/teichoic acid export membrane protein
MSAALPQLFESPRATAQEAPAPPEIGLTSSRLRRWGLQSAFSVVDQGLNALVGFGVNLVLARWLPRETYGAFAMAFAVYLFVSGFHNVLLLEPLSIFGPSRHAGNLRSYFRAQLWVHAVIVGALAVTVVVSGFIMLRFAPANPLGAVLVACGISLPCLLLLWLARRMCYVMKLPSAAVVGSAVYFVLALVGLLIEWFKGATTAYAAFLILGAASVVASLILFARLKIVSTRESPSSFSWKQALAENWGYGKWLLGSAVLYAGTSQLQIVVAGALLGLGAAGTLRAMQIPSLAMSQIITAIGLLVLPVFSFHFGRGEIRQLIRRATWVSGALGVVALGAVGVLSIFSHRIESLLYGGKYQQYAPLMALLAVVPVVNGIAAGYSMALRALQKPQFDLVSNLVAAPVGLISAVLFMHWWGISGAAISIVMAFAASTLTTIICFQLFTRAGNRHCPAEEPVLSNTR